MNKVYSITYNGEFLEEFSATSKKNVKEYIKDHYKGQYKIIHKDGYIHASYYVLKNFEIAEVQKE